MPTSYDEEERIYHKGFRDGWTSAVEYSKVLPLQGTTVRGDNYTVPVPRKGSRSRITSPKPKRKASAYSKRYGAAFRKVAPRFKLKSGSWKANGFKNAQKAAHKMARK